MGFQEAPTFLSFQANDSAMENSTLKPIIRQRNKANTKNAAWNLIWGIQTEQMEEAKSQIHFFFLAKKITFHFTWLSLLRNVAFSIIFKHFNSRIRLWRFRSFLMFWVEGELCSKQPCKWNLQVWELPQIILKTHRLCRNRQEKKCSKSFCQISRQTPTITQISHAYQVKAMILLCHHKIRFKIKQQEVELFLISYDKNGCYRAVLVKYEGQLWPLPTTMDQLTIKATFTDCKPRTTYVKKHRKKLGNAIMSMGRLEEQWNFWQSPILIFLVFFFHNVRNKLQKFSIQKLTHKFS